MIPVTMKLSHFKWYLFFPFNSIWNLKWVLFENTLCTLDKCGAISGLIDADLINKSRNIIITAYQLKIYYLWYIGMLDSESINNCGLKWNDQ